MAQSDDSVSTSGDSKLKSAVDAAPRELNLFATAVLCWASSTFVVWLGVEFGTRFMKPQNHGWETVQGDDRNVAANWDGVWYQQIARDGYSYDSNVASNVVFFPAYPLICRWTAAITRLRLSVAMVAVSNACFLAAMMVMALYLRRRSLQEAEHDSDWHSTALLLLAILPTGLFFRMAYTESLFLLIMLLTMYGMSVRWPLLVIAALIGLATGTRPVGVALLLPFAWHLWNHRLMFRFGDDSANVRGVSPPAIPASALVTRTSGPGFFIQSAMLQIVACWGLLAFAAYLWFETGDPLAFSKNQIHWVTRGEAPWSTRLSALVTLEPFWGAYVPSNAAYWMNFDPASEPLLSLRFADPIIFGVTAVLVVIGWKNRWVTRPELLLSLGLLGIPYLLHAYPAAMQSQGRYMAVVFPAVTVMSRIIATGGQTIVAVLLGFGGVLLALWSGMFATWWRVF